MSRISLLETEDAPRLLQRIFKQMEQAYGAVPNTARALAQVPDFVTATAGLAKIESHEGELPKTLKFLAKVRVAHRNQCTFCMDIGYARARKEDLLSEAQLAALAQEDVFSAHDWNPQETLVLRATDALTNDMTLPDDLFGQLRDSFSEAQIVELTAQIATETFYNILNRAWGIGSQGFSHNHAIPGEEKGI